MRRAAVIAATLAIIAITTTADAQTGLLGQLLNRIARPTSAAGPGAAGAAPRGAPVAAVAPTPAQLDTIRRRLADAAPTPVIRQEVTDASAVIEPTVVAIACATDSIALRGLNGRRLQPHNYGTPDDALNFTAMGGMRYHDRSTCVDLNRVAAVSKPALNELQLTLNFVSASSGEAKVQTISFRKVGNEWLIDQLTPFDI